MKQKVLSLFLKITGKEASYNVIEKRVPLPHLKGFPWDIVPVGTDGRSLSSEDWTRTLPTVSASDKKGKYHVSTYE